MNLEISNLSIGYSNNTILSNINLQANAGEYICLIGANGCGKSTLLKSILGLIPTISGNILAMGKNAIDYSTQQKAHIFSAVLSEQNSYCDLTVSEIIALGRAPFTNWLGTLRDKDVETINSTISKLHLESFHNKHFQNLSDGEKQKTMIAKAIVQETPIIILDEPTSHLDLPTRIEITNLLKELATDKQKTIITSVHDIDAALCADQIWMVIDGTIIKGTPEDLILSRQFSKLFPTLEFRDDIEKFVAKTVNTNTSINVVGEGNRAKWTKHALMRLKNVPEGLTIIVNDNSWSIDFCDRTIETDSIDGLITTIKKLR